MSNLRVSTIDSSNGTAGDRARTSPRLGGLLRYLAALVVLVIAFGPAASRAAAKSWTVCSSGCAYSTIAAAVFAARPGDRINLAAGTFAAADVVLDKPGLVLHGRGSSTVIDGEGTSAFEVQADRITIRNLRITDGYQGIRVEKDAQTVSRLTLDGLTIDHNSDVGLELNGSVTLQDLVVRNSTFVGNRIAIRFSSQTIGKEVLIRNNRFSDQLGDAHIYQGDGDGYVDGLTISNNRFTGEVGYSAIYAENLLHARISTNFISDGWFGVTIFPWRPGVTGDIVIANNEFVDLAGASVVIEPDMPFDLPITIFRNRFSQDVSAFQSSKPWILRIALLEGHFSAPITILQNEFVLNQSAPVSATAFFGIGIRGDYAGVTIQRNHLDGGGVSGSGTPGSVPPGAGVYVRGDDEDFGGPTADSELRIRSNSITGFVDGISFYDAVANQFGGMPEENAVTIRGNALGGNTASGVHNGTNPAATIDARGNWWGCKSGPGNPGCSDALGAVLFTPFLRRPL